MSTIYIPTCHTVIVLIPTMSINYPQTVICLGERNDNLHQQVMNSKQADNLSKPRERFRYATLTSGMHETNLPKSHPTHLSKCSLARRPQSPNQRDKLPPKDFKTKLIKSATAVFGHAHKKPPTDFHKIKFNISTIKSRLV